MDCFVVEPVIGRRFCADPLAPRMTTFVMPGHSRPKDGVASARLCPGHPRLAFFTSPRLRGEVGSPSAIRVRGYRSKQEPLTPTLSPQERGEGEENVEPIGGTASLIQLPSYP